MTKSKNKLPGENYPFDTSLRRNFLDEYDFVRIVEHIDETPQLPQIGRLRLFVEHINALKQRKSDNKRLYSPAELFSIGLINEIFHYIADEYEKSDAPHLWKNFSSAVTQEKKETIFRKYIEFFPPLPVYRGIIDEEEYFQVTDNGKTVEETITKDLFFLVLNMDNPAFQKYSELFDDSDFVKCCKYRSYTSDLISFLKSLKKIGPNANDLYNLFREPVEDSPNSITGQLEYILKYWARLLPEHLLMKLLKSFDILSEEFLDRGGPGGAKETFVPNYLDSDLYPEYEAFSEDRDWMPRVVLLAKSTYVWLHQLSVTYDREITKLDDIPDEELDKIARWGFTGLWLIGLWERSTASEKIKRIKGNPEAISSAYSLYDYRIADTLGGEEALQKLKYRCAQRGIRLAADMVPNHFGIYSKWVIENPDRFLALDYPPYPHYRFTGENLSEDSRVGIYIEDGYWNNTDAAVIFKRVDFYTGSEKYIYHGNDGTTMPWNDTAQINYLNPEAREAIIQVIIEVAKRFPIIRFDAAMTLANKHIQRLWFPAPGSGGAIPSRAEHGMSPEEFKRHMPKEFWRELVDRIAQEAPDTLLLAEAFWLMEGYFVRTLGMHRVYNSAFMNMLMKEENQKYRNLIKETLEFNPEILKRYVNFMSNPDEATAVEQFSKGDKYFGVSLMMVTLPGLPMWAHGQIEGFTEKYGMEYSRAYYDEQPDVWLIERHEKEIFPLMRKRHLFSGVSHFTFYDFFTMDGWVDENVFAYSNVSMGEKALVIYNNRYGDTHGYIKLSTGRNSGSSDAPNIQQKTLFEALEFTSDERTFVIFRDQKSSLEYIRDLGELREKGIFVMLGPYQAHAFVDFREVYDKYGDYAKLNMRLNGRGVDDIDEALHELKLEPILAPLRAYFNAGLLHEFVTVMIETRDTKFSKEKTAEKIQTFFKKSELIEKAGALGKSAIWFSNCEEANLSQAIESFTKNITEDLATLVELDAERHLKSFQPALRDQLVRLIPEELNASSPVFWRVLLVFIWMRNIGYFCSGEQAAQAIIWYREWMLHKLAQRVLMELGATVYEAEWESRMVEVLLEIYGWEQLMRKDKYPFVREHIYKSVIQRFLKVHSFEGMLWFNKENFVLLLDWALVIAYHSIKKTGGIQWKSKFKQVSETLSQLGKEAENSEYKFLEFIQAIDPQKIKKKKNQ